MEEEYTLPIPANIKVKKDLVGDISKEDCLRAPWLCAAGYIPIGIYFAVSHVDYFTILLILSWTVISFAGFVKCLYYRRRSMFKQFQIMLHWLRSQKRYRYHYKKEWR